MKKIFAVFALTPFALSSCSLLEKDKMSNLGETTNEALKMIDNAQNILHKSFVGDNIFPSSNNARNDKPIEKTLVNEVDSCKIQYSIDNSSLGLVSGISASKNKLIYQEVNPHKVLESTINGIPVKGGLVPKEKKFFDLEFGIDPLQITTFVSQSIYDSEITNPLISSSNTNSQKRLFNENTIGKWASYSKYQAEDKITENELGINCGTFLNGMDQWVNKLRAHITDPIIEMKKTILDKVTIYEYKQTESNNMFKIIFNNETELPINIDSIIEHDEIVEKFMVNVISYNDVIIELPTENEIIEINTSISVKNINQF